MKNQNESIIKSFINLFADEKLIELANINLNLKQIEDILYQHLIKLGILKETSYAIKLTYTHYDISFPLSLEAIEIVGNQMNGKMINKKFELSELESVFHKYMIDNEELSNTYYLMKLYFNYKKIDNEHDVLESINVDAKIVKH